MNRHEIDLIGHRAFAKRYRQLIDLIIQQQPKPFVRMINGKLISGHKSSHLLPLGRMYSKLLRRKRGRL